MRTRLLPVVLLLALATACGGGDDEASNQSAGSPQAAGSLRPADEVLAEASSAAFTTVPLGEQVEVPSFNAVTVEGEDAPASPLRGTVTRLTPSANDQRPVVLASFRIENPSDEDAAFPKFTVVCAGNTREGAYQADSTANEGDPIPAGSFVEGEQVLFLPRDSDVGEVYPDCAGPAFVRVGGSSGPQWELAADSLTRLNATAARTR